MRTRQDNMPKRNKKNFRPTKAGAGMTRAGVAAYRRNNPGSKLKTAVTGKVKKGSAAAKRRKSYCARSAGTPASGENSMVRQAQRNYIGSYVSGDLGGVQVSNPSSRKYYSNPGFKMPKI